jgi:Putative outer membrane beta-barrel porin, MtrB/PioB
MTRRRWQLLGVIGGASVVNDESRIVADNPCFGTPMPAGCGAGADTVSRGQSSLPPDNMAHTFNLSGGVNLPLRTRLSGNFTYSLRLQNESFLPHTINPALAADPSLVLPRKSLNGNAQVFAFNLNATSRPLPLPVVFTAKYRLFDYRDLSDTIVFPGHVVNDRTLATEPRNAGRWSYSKQDASLDARWKVLERLSFTTGVGWERWDHNEHREVPVSDEFSAKGVLDYTPPTGCWSAPRTCPPSEESTNIIPGRTPSTPWWKTRSRPRRVSRYSSGSSTRPSGTGKRSSYSCRSRRWRHSASPRPWPTAGTITSAPASGSRRRRLGRRASISTGPPSSASRSSLGACTSPSTRSSAPAAAR